MKVNGQLADQLAALATENALGCGTVTPQESRYDNLPTQPHAQPAGTFGGLDEMITTNKPEAHPRVYDGPGRPGHGVQGG